MRRPPGMATVSVGGSLQIASTVADGVYKAQLSTLVNPHSE